jgi:hypothetical protein
MKTKPKRHNYWVLPNNVYKILLSTYMNTYEYLLDLVIDNYKSTTPNRIKSFSKSDVNTH